MIEKKELVERAKKISEQLRSRCNYNQLGLARVIDDLDDLINDLDNSED